MSLRARLSLSFALVVLLPLLVGVILVLVVLPDVEQDRARELLDTRSRSVAALLAGRCDQVDAAAAAVAAAPDPDTARRSARRVVAAGLASGVRVTDAAGGQVLTVGTLPPGPEPATAPASCRGEDGATSPALSAVVPGLSPGSQVLAAVSLDATLLGAVGDAVGAGITIVRDGVPVASSLPVEEAATVAAQPLTTSFTGIDGLLVAPAGAPGLPDVRVSSEAPQGAGATRTAMVLAAVLGVLSIAALLGLLLARHLTRPLAELADAAARVAAGDLSTRTPVRRPDEVGRLAVAFNGMTDELRSTMAALRASQDEHQRGLMRMGETLSSTHDLSRILGVTLETAMASVRAQAGAVLLHDSPDELRVEVGRGLEERGLVLGARLAVGEGVTGAVAASGEPVRGRVGSGPGELALAVREPAVSSVIAAPLLYGGRVLGVLNLFDRADGAEFDESDLSTIRTLAGEAAIAVENVLRHEEAQRLSITDGLTGLWNRRYANLALPREIERAGRYRRPLGVLLLDLDHFKDVNDRFGHQRGDEVLVEVAQRVRSTIREVDVLARYGGEELLLVLPETDAAGVRRAAERVVEVVGFAPYLAPDRPPLRLTISVGAAVFPLHGTRAEDLLSAADQALYAAKDEGRDGWQLAAAPPDAGRAS